MELIKKDNTGNIRVVILMLDDYTSYFVIRRKTGLLNGTMTEQPNIFIEYGKANRTVQEQAQLEFNSILSDYFDSGYRKITDYGIKRVGELNQSIITKILHDKVVDTNGATKPMLAKMAFAPTDLRFRNLWYASYKIDGVRCTLRYDRVNKKILDASRGGKSFSNAIKHITENESLKELFSINPDLVIDGELYLHGKPLQFINGLARTKYYDPNIHECLEFWIFDIVTDKIFYEREEMLNSYKEQLSEIATRNVDFDIMNYIQFVEHTLIKGYDNILGLHKEAVDSGYEGLILRDPDKSYGFGTRDYRMIKIKMFEDAEFTIIGKSNGLREEDMVFVLMAPNGRTFEAKPVGTRGVREFYNANIDLYIGKRATVKYFGYTPDGVPNLPVLKYIRG